MDHVYGGLPPLAASVTEYARFSVPPGSEDVLMVSGAACTVSDVLPEIPLSVAEMVVVPAARAVASPEVLMVAIEVLDELQVTWLVTSWVVASP
jgi:hypothetical protein